MYNVPWRQLHEKTNSSWNSSTKWTKSSQAVYWSSKSNHELSGSSCAHLVQKTFHLRRKARVSLSAFQLLRSWICSWSHSINQASNLIMTLQHALQTTERQLITPATPSLISKGKTTISATDAPSSKMRVSPKKKSFNRVQQWRQAALSHSIKKR